MCTRQGTYKQKAVLANNIQISKVSLRNLRLRTSKRTENLLSANEVKLSLLERPFKMKRDGVFCLEIDDVISGYSMETNKKIKNISERMG